MLWHEHCMSAAAMAKHAAKACNPDPEKDAVLDCAFAAFPLATRDMFDYLNQESIPMRRPRQAEASPGIGRRGYRPLPPAPAGGSSNPERRSGSGAGLVSHRNGGESNVNRCETAS